MIEERAYRQFKDLLCCAALFALAIDMGGMFPTRTFIEIFVLHQLTWLHRCVMLCFSLPIFMATPTPVPNGRRSQLGMPMYFNVVCFGVPWLAQVIQLLYTYNYEPARAWIDVLFLLLYTLTCIDVGVVCADVLALDRAKRNAHPKD